MRSAISTVFIALALLLGGCTYFRLPILQGNVVKAETAETIKPGLSRDEVRERLGTPLVTDSFGDARWDYVIYIRDQKGKETRQTLSVYFEADKVSRVQGLENFRKAAAVTEQKPATAGQPAKAPAE